MIVMAKYVLGFFGLLLFSCGLTPEMDADSLIQKTVAAHGWNLGKPTEIAFNFRDYHYEVNRDASGVRYSREKQDSLGLTKDIWTNFSTFERTRNGQVVVLSDSLQTVYANSLNSVLYFAQLPLGLQDQAVVAEYKGLTQLNNQSYHQLAITFKQEGGGEDFQDQFYYWIHSLRFEIDYMAYSYHTNGGGTRFRVGKNKQQVKGLLFQDFDNYKPKQHPSPLDSLAILWEQQDLEWLSAIENTAIEVYRD
jgi:hypothetical protein